MTQSLYFWIGFNVIIALLLAVDLGLFVKKKGIYSIKQAWVHSAFWVALALLFNLFIYAFLGAESALQFFTGYLIEKSLSVDNLFVILTIFLQFRVSDELQHKVLFWGILGSLIFRLCLILTGIALLGHYHWTFYVLGAFIIFAGAQFALQKQKENPSDSWSFRFFNRILPVEQKKGKGNFFVKTNGKWKVTSLFIVLLLIETTDIIFSLDSIPAIFAITTDPFLVYTSNAFAVLGLRSLYFILAASLNKFKFYKLGLGAILVFVGFKMLLIDIYAISLPVSVAIIMAILVVTAAFSWRERRRL